MKKNYSRDVQVCDYCGYVVIGAPHKIKRCVACDGQGKMYIDNETSFHILMNRMEETSHRRSSIADQGLLVKWYHATLSRWNQEIDTPTDRQGDLT